MSANISHKSTIIKFPVKILAKKRNEGIFSFFQSYCKVDIEILDSNANPRFISVNGNLRNYYECNVGDTGEMSFYQGDDGKFYPVLSS